MKAFGDTLQFL